ncbi:MAG: DUF2088 domain-containing protein [Spirochaetales bacterium]|nr:DUF2088 domain-containing protein [Spirochaetales bacterium]
MVSEAQVLEELSRLHAQAGLAGQRVLVIIPDNTRSAPVGLFFRLMHRLFLPSVARLDFLVALGTHPLLGPAEKLKRVGISAEEKAQAYGDVEIRNHRWDLPETFERIGAIQEAEMEQLSGGLLRERSEVWINRLILDYDRLLILGPVFPHEIAGFSGSGKYLFPGICGQEFIDVTHWLGALRTNLQTIGVRETPVRHLIDRATRMVPVPITWLNLVVDEQGLQGLFIGEDRSAWEQAVALSARLNIRYVARRFRRVLSIPSAMYDDLWTGAKAFYKLEPAVADGGEVVIYAPQVKRISITHDPIVDQVGFHVKDYFLAHMDRYRQFSRAVLAYSSLVKGSGEYRQGREEPRVRVTLSSGVPREVCERLNIGYLDPREVSPQQWENRQEEGVAVIHNAGEVLYLPEQQRQSIGAEEE